MLAMLVGDAGADRIMQAGGSGASGWDVPWDGEVGERWADGVVGDWVCLR